MWHWLVREFNEWWAAIAILVVVYPIWNIIHGLGRWVNAKADRLEAEAVYIKRLGGSK